MTYMEEKQQMENTLQDLSRRVQSELPESPTLEKLDQLLADIQNDYYTVVVVGEFKHGKSTFVNALLEEELMPVDVTPTTATINAIFYSEERYMEVVKRDGDVERQELTRENLSQYVANSTFNPDDIRYLKIFMPSPLLKNRVVLVDTPGVNDLNQHRSEITHQFIPRADAVLFMLDMRAAVKNTEEQFLKQITSKEGIQRVLFAANFLDRIDEEDLDEVTDFIERRLQFITEGERPKLFPVSSYEALQGKLNGDEQLLEWSGMVPLEHSLKSLIENGVKANEKLDRYRHRTKGVLESLAHEVAVVESLLLQSVDELEGQMKGIKQWLEETEQWKQPLYQYIHDREDEIKFFVRKSISYFGDRLKKDIANRIQLFHGNDFKYFIETQLPLTIKTQFEQWIDQYSDSINELFVKLEQEISKGLSRSFEQSIRIESHSNRELQVDTNIPLIESNSGNAYVKAGLVIGGAGTLALLLGASFFVPIVAMAGLPFLQNKIMQKQLETIKPELLYAMEEQLTILLNDFGYQVEQFVEKSVYEIREHSVHEFEKQIQYLQETIDKQLDAKQVESLSLHNRMEELEEFKTYIEKIKEGVNLYDRLPITKS